MGSSLNSRAQVTITPADMFNEVGLYYRAYVNVKENLVPASELPGEPGGGKLWDFVSGPQDQVFRFDYLQTGNDVPSFEFRELASIAERKTEEINGNLAWLFFDQVPEVGRRVFGFYDLEFSSADPSALFAPPIVDFPAQIDMGDSWTTVTSYETLITVLDLGGIPAKITHSSTFEVDAFGLIELPNLGFGDCLRVNELAEISTAVDFEGNGQYQHADTQYVRNYYWLRAGLGLVAQLNSIPSASPPSGTFAEAAYFVRMFETNKKPGTGCTEATPVTALRVSISNGQALVKWTKSPCSRSYRVEYTSGSLGPGSSWQELGTTNGNFLLDTTVADGTSRYYRVVSLR